MAAAVSTGKQDQLVASIKDGVVKAIEPTLAELIELNTRNSVTLNAILARLAVIEELVSAGTVPKKAVRSTTASVKKGAAKADASKVIDDKSKVTNALLFLRWALKYDYHDSRTNYATPEIMAESESETTVSKYNKDTQEREYYGALGSHIWRKLFSDDQKAEIRTQFNAWKEYNGREEAAPQLEQEMNEDEETTEQ